MSFSNVQSTGLATIIKCTETFFYAWDIEDYESPQVPLLY